jgi:hypothetical protein
LISCHCQFLGVIEFLTQLLCLGARRRLEHGIDGLLCLSSGVHPQNM